jgi:hypothetical protein
VGDVHPIEIKLTRADGTAVMPRAIAWLDVATQRLHVTLIQLEKGEGVKQVHVAQSFAAMCSAWGLTRQLYLDNGSEYGWQDMMEGFAQLSRLTGVELDTRLEPQMAAAPNAVVRARPYNAQAKPIEGIFALLEQQVLSMLPGWIGGNRMRQKTHNVGRAPQAFGGDWESFHQSFDHALAYYHARAQPRSRSLKGKSPNQALNAAIAAGCSAATQIARLRPRVKNRLVIVDEANHLKWPQLEGLRFLADEAGMALLLMGTDIMNRQFRTPQTGVYLTQLASRIGAKTLHLTRMRRIDEGQAYALQPLFGQVERATAKRFMQVSQGYWRDSIELARACQRLMAPTGLTQLTSEIIDTAAVWMTEGRRD